MTSTATVPLQRKTDLSFYARSLGCVHCGLCLPHCPTYRVLGIEPDSPRGRIYLMRAWAEDRVVADDAMRLHLSQCLDCRGCETACPSGVHYGEMLEFVRNRLETEQPTRSPIALLRKLTLRHLFARPGRLRAAFTVLSVVEQLGLRRWLRFLRLMPPIVGTLDRMFPAIPPARAREPLRGTFPAIGPRRARVAMFTGCVMEQVFGHVNRATLAVLRHNGCEVVIPDQQVCCGALHVHNGQTADAVALARQNLRAFPSDVDFVVLNSAGCGAALKELPHILPEAAAFSAKVRDVSQVLASLGIVPPPHPVQRKVAYDDPCHLCHAQKVREEPRQMLRAIAGLRLVPLRDAEACCGSAGIYNTVHTELSMQILADKVRAIAECGADVIATGNPGCAMQIAQGTRSAGLDIQVVHPVELLAEAYGAR